jgi:hypothetical protein
MPLAPLSMSKLTAKEVLNRRQHSASLNATQDITRSQSRKKIKRRPRSLPHSVLSATQ